MEGLHELTYIDQQTGLMWARNGNIACIKMDWQVAMEWVKKLNYGGYSDWRLPTIEELGVFAERVNSPPYKWFNTNGFNSVQAEYYWAGTEAATTESGEECAWVVDMRSHLVLPSSNYDASCVWPVRGGDLTRAPWSYLFSLGIFDKENFKTPEDIKRDYMTSKGKS